MIQLFLDNTEIYIPTSQTIKLTRENPYIVSSGDYTMDVQAPLSIAANRAFFGPWHRVETGKMAATYAARLYASNTCVLNGSAKVTSVTDEYVKLQLYGDQSEFNAVFGDLYIDELPLPYCKWLTYASSNRASSSGATQGSSRRGTFTTRTATSDGYATKTTRRAITSDEAKSTLMSFVPVYDEAADNVANRYAVLDDHMSTQNSPQKIYNPRPQWNLLYTLKCVFETVGYTLDWGPYDACPYNIIVIANCSAPSDMAAALPHWTLKEFVEQVGRFYGCAFKFASGKLSVEMQPLSEAYSEAVTEIDAIDEFSVDVAEDNEVKSAGTSNLHYDLSDSDAHGTGYIDPDVLSQMPVKEYSSKSELEAAYNAMSDAQKTSYIFRCPEGDYCQWTFTDAEDSDTTITQLIHVNQFADLERKDSSDGDTENAMDLKIVPVAIRDDLKIDAYYERSARGVVAAKKPQYYVVMPSMEGSESDIFSPIVYSGERTSALDSDDATVQELLEGSSSDDSSEKPDRMEVFFVYDFMTQLPTKKQYGGDTLATTAIPIAFTAWDHKNQKYQPKENFSLSMNQDESSANMAKWHKAFNINSATKYTIKFVNEGALPVASNVYLIRNRRFLCEKLELEIKDGTISPLVTGYFYPLN